jgi:hypothetical protein
MAQKTIIICDKCGKEGQYDSMYRLYFSKANNMTSMGNPMNQFDVCSIECAQAVIANSRER